MISAAQIIAKLKADCPALSSVGGAGAFASAVDQLRITNSAFVMPPTETAQPNATGTMVTRQRSEIRARVILGFIVRGQSGNDQSGDVDTAREALKTCLVGWTPDSNIYAPLGLVGTAGLAAGKDGTVVFYACDFRSFYFVRAPSP